MEAGTTEHVNVRIPDGYTAGTLQFGVTDVDAYRPVPTCDARGV